MILMCVKSREKYWFPLKYTIGNYKVERTKRYSKYILDPYLFSDLIKRQLTLSNNDYIEIDLFIVSFPYPIIPFKHHWPSAWIYDIPWSQKVWIYNKLRSSIQPEMLRHLMFISIERCSVNFDTQSAFKFNRLCTTTSKASWIQFILYDYCLDGPAIREPNLEIDD